MITEFKAFIMRGNVIDMAVGIIIGAAFGTIVGSLVSDILMPPFGLLLGNVDYANLFLVLREGVAVPGPYATLAQAKTAGAVTMNYGVFFNHVLSFLIVSFAVFMMVRHVNKLYPKPDAAPAVPSLKDCPYCLSAIPTKATRCRDCASDVVAPA